MAIGKNDWKQLDKHLEKQHKKITSDVQKLLVAQDIRNWGKMEDLEEKFEKKVTEVKSEFFEKIDPVLKEVSASREERKIVSRKLSEHTDQIEKIQKHLGLPTQN